MFCAAVHARGDVKAPGNMPYITYSLFIAVNH